MSTSHRTLSSTRISYTALLAALFVLLLIVLNVEQLWLYYSQAVLPIIIIIVLLVFIARRQGRRLMRDESYDSIWEFRWFFLGFWVVMTLPNVASVISFPSTTTFVLLSIMILIVGVNIVGIVIHRNTRARLVKNIQKEKLFQ